MKTKAKIPKKATNSTPKPKEQKRRADSLWYKDALIYQLNIRSFADSDQDGIGDFIGLTQKLDYLTDLGITAIWVLPFYPSPLRDEGYDISDYRGIQPMYGTMNAFRTFLREAHKRDIRVVTEIVINHTSDQHAWFQKARRAQPGSNARNFYVWSDSPQKYKDARVIFKDFEQSNWTWDPVAKAYYWHRFYSHQPDLNFDNPEVRKALLKVIDYWFDLGVDGVRLDAVPYLFEREDTSCENLPETHQFLKEVRHYVNQHFSDRMLLAEANQWPEDAVAYFGAGDECHMAFHFPIMPRMFMAIHMEDRFPIIDVLEQTPAIPDSAQWAIFLRNHDELTLEMVTDEERDYMYRVYANDPQARLNLGIRRRLAPLLGNNRRKIELMNGLLFSLPGTPIIYYGDEIGMGDNIYLGDRNGVRTPMQWSGDRNAGFSKANPQKLYSPIIIDPEYHYETVNVEAQQSNPHSLLWWMKRMIAIRKKYKAFGRGTIEFLDPENNKVLVFVREFEGEKILVVANLSRFAQYVEIDLARFKGMVPIEIFGNNRFPLIGNLPYFITLGPHGFLWFSIEKNIEAPMKSLAQKRELPRIEANEKWDDVLGQRKNKALLDNVSNYLIEQRWFAGKDRKIKSVKVADIIPIAHSLMTAKIMIVVVDYIEGEPERYLLPIAYVKDVRVDQVEAHFAKGVIARLRVQRKSGKNEEGLLYDAVYDGNFARVLMDILSKRRRVKGNYGEMEAISTQNLRKWWPQDVPLPEPTLSSAEQSNSSIILGHQMIIKLYRRLQPGQNPDLEISLHLNEDNRFPHIPKLGGYWEYQAGRGSVTTLGIVQEWVANEGDAWHYTLGQLGLFYERVLTRTDHAGPHLREKDLVDLSQMDISTEIKELIGEYIEKIKQLAERTAELHIALAEDDASMDFTAETLTFSDVRSVYQSIRNGASKAFRYLARQRPHLPDDINSQVEVIINAEEQVVEKIQPLLKKQIKAKKIRCHGDYHLGQVLFTGKDFVILDFEGEPLRSIAERRIKRSPLKDVAGMIRSFHYAAFSALWDDKVQTVVPASERVRLEGWAHLWYRIISSAFLKAYLTKMAKTDVLPTNKDDLKLLLTVFLLDKGLYEITYELKHRPKWIGIPIQGINELVMTDDQHE